MMQDLFTDAIIKTRLQDLEDELSEVPTLSPADLRTWVRCKASDEKRRWHELASTIADHDGQLKEFEDLNLNLGSIRMDDHTDWDAWIEKTEQQTLQTCRGCLNTYLEKLGDTDQRDFGWEKQMRRSGKVKIWMMGSWEQIKGLVSEGARDTTE